MFVDQVKLFIKAGDGGNGTVAFRREKFVPKGGPAGGEGGKGGDIVFKVDQNLSTLMDLRFNKHIKSKNGENGQSKSMDGKNADVTIVKVPPGTTVTDDSTGLVIADLVDDGQEVVIAKGGRGGRGNKAFATSANPAPSISEKGEPGEEKDITVELKLLADVGLVGFPSVGKSTILSMVSAAKPKIAAYHFTTLVPNLGVVQTKDQRSFVMADLPGLIEGASLGHGLGHQFLRHIERTRVIVHVIDMSGLEGRDPYTDFMQINKELEDFNPQLLKRPQVIVANKMDIDNADENLAIFKQKVTDYPIFEVSAAMNEGLDDVLYKVADLLAETPQFPLFSEEQVSKNVIYKFERDIPFVISKDTDGSWILSGDKLEKLFKMTNFDSEESINRFARQLRGMGVDQALREAGCQDSDIVRILDYEFEFIE